MASLSKFFLKSKTILGLIVTVVPDIANFLDTASPFIPPQYQEIVRFLGVGLAAIGRFGAKVPLKLTP